jgi:hypothetical protein
VNKLGPLLVIFFVIGILFFPYFKNQNAPLPIDIPVGMYYPWLNDSYGYAVRPPVKNSLISDTVSQFWIWRNRGVSDLLDGKLNIWNPYSFSGYEMSPWFHTMLFSPPNIFYIFLPQIDAMSMIVISQVFLSLLGGFLLGKLVFSSSISGWMLAFSWTMSSFFIGWLTWGTISFALAMLPWTIYFFEKYLSSQNKKLSLFLSLSSLVFLILSGHPQTIGYCFVIFYLWGSVRLFESSKKILPSLLKPLILIVLALIVSAPAIFPSLKIVGQSIRSLESLSSVNFGFIPWSKLLVTLFSANAFGNPSSGNYFGGDYNFQEKLVNFGIIPLFLAIYQLVKIIRFRKISSFGLIGTLLFILGILLVTQYPIGFLIYRFNLPLLSTSPAGRGIILTIFGGIILASSSIRDLFEGRIDRKTFWLTTIPFTGTLIMFYSLLLGTLNFISQSNPTLAGSYEVLKMNFTTAVRNTIYPLVILTGFFGLVFISVKIPRLKSIAVYALLTLSLLESFIFFKKVTPFVPKNLLFPETPSISFIKDQATKSANLFRFERESGELLPPNMWEVYHFYSTSGYDPIAPLRYEEYMNSLDVHGSISRYFENGASIDKLGEFGVKYFMTLKRNEVSVPDSEGRIRESLDQRIWKPVFSEGPVVVLENQNYSPPYFLEESGEGTLVTLRSKTDDSWEFSASTPTDNRFILIENYSDHWQASIDGSPVKVERYKNTFKQIAVPQGDHLITFVYYNSDLLTGIIISFFGLMFFSLYLLRYT